MTAAPNSVSKYIVLTEKGQAYVEQLDRNEPWFAAGAAASLARMYPNDLRCAMRYSFTACAADGSEITVFLPREVIVYREGKPLKISILEADLEMPNLFEDLMREQMGLPQRKAIQAVAKVETTAISRSDFPIDSLRITPDGLAELAELRRKPILSPDEAAQYEILDCLVAAEEFTAEREAEIANATAIGGRVLVFPRH